MKTATNYFEAILNATTESIFLVDVQGFVLAVNDTAAQRLNQTRTEMIGKYAFDFFPPDAAVKRRQDFEEVVSTGLAKHTEDSRAGRFFSLNYYPGRGANGKVDAVAVEAADITARKQAEEALRNSELRYRPFAEELPVGILITQDGLIKYANPATFRMIGYPEDEFLGEPFIPFVFDADRSWLMDLHRRRMNGEEVASSFSVSMVRKDGEIRQWNIHTSTIEWDGKLSALASIIDVTENKQAEDELRIAATAFESQEGMFVTDADEVIRRVNHSFTNITGYSAEEAVGQTPDFLSSGRHDAAFFAARKESILRNDAWQGEIWNRRKSGEIYPEWL